MFMDSLGKYLVSRVKDERTTMYKEIETLSGLVEPIYVNDREEQIEYWIYEIPKLQRISTFSRYLPSLPISPSKLWETALLPTLRRLF